MFDQRVIGWRRRLAPRGLLRAMSALCLVAFAQSAHAQSVKRIRSTSTTPCAGCRLQIDSVLTLGADDADTSYFFEDQANQMAVTAANQLVVTGNALPMVFDLNGRFLRRLGHKGGGPGEFPLPPLRFWIAPGDELHFSIRAFRLVVVYRPDGSFVRQYRLSHSAKDPLRLPDGRIVAQHPPGQFAGYEVLDYPVLRVFSANGELQKEIGRGVTIADRGMFVGVDGTIWTWKAYPYSLRQWAADGRQLASFERIIPGFGTGPFIIPPWSEPLAQARVTSAQQHDDGLLWVTYQDSPHRKNCRGALEACTDTKVEVLDPATGALIASARVPVFLTDIGRGYFASRRVSMGRGAPVVIYRVKLIRPAARGTPQ